MNGLEKLNLRLNYRGGAPLSLLQEDKLRSLKRAIMCSYQTETITIHNGNTYLCLINPNKNVDDYDDKILSIPFETIEMNNSDSSETYTLNNVEEGDVIK